VHSEAFLERRTRYQQIARFALIGLSLGGYVAFKILALRLNGQWWRSAPRRVGCCRRIHQDRTLKAL